VKRSGGRLVASLVFLFSDLALANGRYPTAGLVAFDPNDARHFAVRTTFGLLVTSDRGATFDMVCESALRLVTEEDPMLAFTGSGPLVVATFGGVLRSDDGCSFRYVPELEGEIVIDLARGASDPDSLVAVRLRGRGGGLYDSNLLRSDDSGATFREFPPFPEELLVTTVDVAARDPSRVYVTARRGADEGYDSVLLASDDGGETFRAALIPDTQNQHLAYIAGVHPSDPERLALRVDDLEQTILYETLDGGETFAPRFTASGRLTAFAYSPDGAEMLFGGIGDGLYGGSSDGTAFERRSDVGATCLGWNDDGVLACADAQNAGFSLGRSKDGGRTFERLLVFSELCGTSSCGGASDVGALCPHDWQSVAPLLAATCNTDAGAPDAGAAHETAAAKAGRGGCSVGSGPRGSMGILLAAASATLLARLRRMLGRSRARGTPL
jgi:hypothetical protein